MRVFVFEEDPSFLSLLLLYLKKMGHDVQGFMAEYNCSLYLMEECTCPAAKPCAEAVIVSARAPGQASTKIFRDQRQKGCRLPNFNKAVMSAGFTETSELQIRAEGFSVIKKPFKLDSLNDWLQSCDERLAENQP